MMMSSNTVGTTDFNTVGAVSHPTKKAGAPKEKAVKLTPIQPDSVTKAQKVQLPRQAGMAEDTPMVTTAPAKPSILPELLGGGAALLAAGTALFVGLKHGESETALKLAQSTAKTAKKEASELKTQVAALVKGSTPDEVDAQIQKGITDWVNNFQTPHGHTLTDLDASFTHLQENINARDPKIDKAGQDIQDIVGRVDSLETNKLSHKNRLKRIEAEQANQATQLTNLENILDPRVAGKSVSKEVKDLFKTTENPENFNETVFAKVIADYEDKSTTTNSLNLIREGLATLDPEKPGSITQLLQSLPESRGGIDPYHSNFFDLKYALQDISAVFQGKYFSDEDLSSENVSREAIEKAQAVVGTATKKDAKVDEVKTAQTALIDSLKEQFGRSRTEAFSAKYGETGAQVFAKTSEDTPIHGWVTEHFNPKKSLDEMADVILTGGLNGTNTNNTHKDVTALQSVVLSNLMEAVVKAYPQQLAFNTETGSIQTVRGASLSEEMRNLRRTLNVFKQTLQPITVVALEADTDGLFRETSVVDLAELESISKLRAEMMNARLQGKTDDIERLTAEMYTQLRADLQALKDAPAVVVTPPTTELPS